MYCNTCRASETHVNQHQPSGTLGGRSQGNNTAGYHSLHTFISIYGWQLVLNKFPAPIYASGRFWKWTHGAVQRWGEDSSLWKVDDPWDTVVLVELSLSQVGFRVTYVWVWALDVTLVPVTRHGQDPVNGLAPSIRPTALGQFLCSSSKRKFLYFFCSICFVYDQFWLEPGKCISLNCGKNTYYFASTSAGNC